MFGRVLVSAGVAQTGLGQLIFPFAAVVPQDSAVDDDEPSLWTTVFEITIMQRVAADPWGETVLLGGARGASGQGSSSGRGLIELEEELKRTIKFLNATNGVKIRSIARSAVGAVQSEDLGYVASRAYRFEALTTDERDYPAPTRFTAVDAAGAGDADLAWTLPPSRYDRNALVLRRAAGAVPPASPTAATGITVSALATSLTDSPGAGQFSYSLFMGYDELNDPVSSSDRFSPAATATVTVT